MMAGPPFTFFGCTLGFQVLYWSDIKIFISFVLQYPVIAVVLVLLHPSTLLSHDDA